MTYTKRYNTSLKMGQSLVAWSSALIIGLMGTSFAAEVQDEEAYYETMTRGWEHMVPNEHNESKKVAHLYLAKHNPSYRVHSAELQYSFFPLKDRKRFGSLINSWEDKLDNLPKFLGEIHQIYQTNLGLLGKEQDIFYRQRAELAAAITMSKNENNDPTKTNNDRIERLRKIMNDTDFPEELRAKAEYNLIEHKVKHSIMAPTIPPIPYTPEEARVDYLRLLNLTDPKTTESAIDSTTKMSIEYHLAELNELGKGIPEPDMELAQKGYSAVVKNPDSHPYTKRLAQSKLEGIAKKIKLIK
jgi:hypothetical protein